MVEEERAMARSLEYALTKEGFSVLWAADGKRDLEMTIKKPRVLFCWIML
jgi:DNA-binding response OmpR family regulator